jgi:hypothetical protein
MLGQNGESVEGCDGHGGHHGLQQHGADEADDDEVDTGHKEPSSSCATMERRGEEMPEGEETTVVWRVRKSPHQYP